MTLISLREGLGSGSGGWWVGRWFPVEIERKGKGGGEGGGWGGQAKEPASQCACLSTHLSRLPSRKLPLVSLRCSLEPEDIGPLARDFGQVSGGFEGLTRVL